MFKYYMTAKAVDAIIITTTAYLLTHPDYTYT